MSPSVTALARHGDPDPGALILGHEVGAVAVDDPAAAEVGLTHEVGDEGRARQVVHLRGRPICSRILPWFITATVSAMVMASSWSCVTDERQAHLGLDARLSSTCI